MNEGFVCYGSCDESLGASFFTVVLFAAEYKKAKAEGKKCHAKTM
jgi:hypothetical protein